MRVDDEGLSLKSMPTLETKKDVKSRRCSSPRVQTPIIDKMFQSVVESILSGYVKRLV